MNLGEAVSKQWFPPSHFGRLAIFLRRISRIATKTSAVAKGYGETGKDTKEKIIWNEKKRFYCPVIWTITLLFRGPSNSQK
jgi:hypothetical protein